MILLWACMSASTPPLSRDDGRVWMCQRDSGPDTHGMDVQSCCHAIGRAAGTYIVLFLSISPSLPPLSSSWPFPFVCLSGDNSRLTVTQSLTQIRSLRRTRSRMMGLSQPFTRGTHLSQLELQPSSCVRNGRRRWASVYCCREKGWLQSRANQQQPTH